MSVLSDIADRLLGSLSKSDAEPLSKIDEPSDQSQDEQKLVAYIKEKIDSVRQQNSRTAMEGTYMSNMAYLLGYDGVYFDTTYRQFKNVDVKRKTKKNRFKVNKILPTCQNRLARITQSPPRYDVRPNTNSTQDKDAARLSLDVLNNVFEKQRFIEKRQNLHMSAMTGGQAYAQITWDPSLGEPMYEEDPVTGESKLVGYEGDIRIEILNSLEVYPDPLAKSLDDCAWLIKAKVRKLDYFRDRYPERGHAVKEEDAWLIGAMYDLRSNSISTVGMAGSSTQEQMKNSAIEIVYYEKRSKDHPNGRMVVTASGVLLEDKDLPVGEYDIVKFDDIMVGGRFNAEAVITHLRPIQDQYNITRQKCADWIKQMLAGKYLVAKGSGLSQESLNNENGEVVEFNPVPNAPPPTAMNIPLIPQYVYKDLEELDREMDYISGINEISRGVLPSASMPAQGMAFLQEQDQTRIGVMTTRNEMGYAKMGQIILKYACKFYQMPRVIKLAGDGLEYAVKDFLGSDMYDNTDVIVIPGSTIPTSKVLKRQDIMTAFQAGLMGDPADPKLRAKVFSIMEYGDVAEMWKTQALDQAQVKKIIDLIEKSNFSALSGALDEFDNHVLHLEEMNDYRKTDKFQAMDEKQRSVFKWIMDWRLQALVNQTNPGIAQNQMMAQLMVNNMQQMQQQKPVIDAFGRVSAPPPQQQPMMNEPPPGQGMAPPPAGV